MARTVSCLFNLNQQHESELYKTMKRLQLPIVLSPMMTRTMPSGRQIVVNVGQWTTNSPYVGDTRFESVTWEMYVNGRQVASIHDGYVYGWGKFHCTLKCRPPYNSYEIMDHRFHDCGPFDTFEKAVDGICYRIDESLTYTAQLAKKAS